MNAVDKRRAGLALIAFALLILPPVRHALQASMTAQMLLDIPLLAACGWLLAAAVPHAVRSALAGWNHGGVSGLLLASVTASVWPINTTPYWRTTSSAITLGAMKIPLPD